MNGECEDKDQKLALFQEITHLDDFEQCQAILESTNWDIDQAVQSFFSGSGLTRAESPVYEPIYEPPSHDITEIPAPLPMPEPKRLITFNIEYLEQKFQLHVPENQTVGTIKNLINEKIQVPAEKQYLSGWLNKSIVVMDSMKLHDLNLPGEITLHVTNTSKGSQAPSSSNYLNGYDSKTYEVHIKLVHPSGQIKIINQSTSLVMENNGQPDRTFRIKFDPGTSFIEIRRSLSKLTNSIVNNQEWFYFKDESNLEDLKNCNSLDSFHQFIEDEKIFELSLNSLVEDQTSLAQIKKNLDQLTNKESKSSKLSPSEEVIKIGFVVTLSDFEANGLSDLLTITKPEIMQPTEQMDTQENESFDEDITDEMEENFISEDSTIKRPKPLISNEMDPSEELQCTSAFNEEFSVRYGPLTPLFFIGRLEDAIQEALMCPAKERKLLAIYLHSDKTIFHNIFCSKTLCDENVVNFLGANFVVWPWDLTGKKFEEFFNEKCSRHLGSVFTSSLRALKERLPVLLIVTRVRGSNEVAAIIQGDSTNDQMMNRLMQAYEMFEMQRISDERDEQSRDEREKIKREQDAAYQESLEVDKAKRQRQLEEEQKMRREAEAEAEKERIKIEEKLNRKKYAMDNLPEEPGDYAPTSQVTRIRFRLPDGEFVQRKFFIDNKLKSVIDFVTGHGFFIEQYKLLSSWPRKDLTVEDYGKTIHELKLYPQETLTLEERS
ncbi:FAS-associated factor 1 [Brachionus plicatilis]|uniref:FAS-associated factor 1 n=1 Tax=Brachionus plicatilis TaxID=10195 RepID=A0A3M7P255_BRAPC|nr:FAS-associated factor 1 [Brachionus plicatilis]